MISCFTYNIGNASFCSGSWLSYVAELLGMCTYIYVCVFIHTDVTNHKYRFVKDMLETIDQYIGIDDQLLICWGAVWSDTSHTPDALMGKNRDITKFTVAQDQILMNISPGVCCVRVNISWSNPGQNVDIWRRIHSPENWYSLPRFLDIWTSVTKKSNLR